uniref:Lipid-binding serum glycoprotein N-terminal domain-containing protein n=1 Tax=Dromaius novaehollandiae TaxID=8790 RepID=A0A8C4JBR0_DRONO
MKMFKIFGALFFCGLLTPSQEVPPDLSCAVSPGALRNVLAGAMLQNGLLQQHLQSLVLPNIMGEGGLLNAPISITGLHLVKAQFPDLSVILLPGIGVQMTIVAKLDLKGNSLVGLLSEIIDIVLDVSITANIKCTNYELGTVQVIIEDCLCIFAVIPLGTAGTIQYQLARLPFTSGSFLGLDLDGTVQQMGGSIIPHDSSFAVLPPVLDKLLVLGLHQSFLNEVLSLLIQRPSQRFPCTPEAVSTAAPDSVPLCFLQCSSCPRTDPPSIKIALSGSPLLLLEANKASLKLCVMIQLFVQHLDESVRNLLLLKAVSINVKTSNGCSRLLLSCAWQTSHRVVSSLVQISSLKPHCKNLLVEKFLPLLDGTVTGIAVKFRVLWLSCGGGGEGVRVHV